MSETTNSIGYFVCPICKMDFNIINSSKLKCENCNCHYNVDDDIPILLPAKLDDFKRLEAEYHDIESSSYAEINMISSYRVVYHHDRYLKYIKALPVGSVVLEVGGGDGTEASKLLGSGLVVIQSDISLGMVKIAKTKGNLNQIHVVCDAEHIPCKNESIDAVIIVGALHHLPSPEVFFREANRVLKCGGLLVVGFEPNTWPYYLVYPMLKRIGSLLGVRKRFKYTEISIADQETNGFKEKELRAYLRAGNLELVELQRVWFLSGFIHMFLSSINSKFFSKDNKIDLPIFAQRIIIKIDTLISKIPVIRSFCWHWSVIAKKL